MLNAWLFVIFNYFGGLTRQNKILWNYTLRLNNKVIEQIILEKITVVNCRVIKNMILCNTIKEYFIKNS